MDVDISYFVAVIQIAAWAMANAFADFNKCMWKTGSRAAHERTSSSRIWSFGLFGAVQNTRFNFDCKQFLSNISLS